MSQNVSNIHEPGEQVTDWQTALRYLKDGNKRYLDGCTIVGSTTAADRAAMRDAQKPFAVIVTCSDSRVVPEIYFDQKLGDIFGIRNAGHTATPNALGSIEFAAGHLKVPLIVVVGHSLCGAVMGSMPEHGHVEYPTNLQTVIDAIRPTVKGCQDLDEAIRVHINHVVSRIKENAIVQKYGTMVIGAYYNIETGEVSFL